MLNMRKLTLDWLIAASATVAILGTMAYLDDTPTQQEIAAQEIDQAIIDEIKGQREQKAAEFNRLAAEAERMTGMKAGMK